LFFILKDVDSSAATGANSLITLVVVYRVDVRAHIGYTGVITVSAITDFTISPVNTLTSSVTHSVTYSAVTLPRPNVFLIFVFLNQL
jgi:hypothetical protein